MTFTQDFFLSLITWLFLIITITTAFIKPKYWPIGLLCTLVSGLFFNAFDLVGLGIVTVLFTLAFYASKPANTVLFKNLKVIITAIVFIACIALAAHLLPGFNNLQVLDDVEKSVNSVPFSLYLNFDKPMILFVLVILYPTVLMNNKAVFLFQPGAKLNDKLRLSFVLLVGFIVIFALALSLSLISFEPQLPSWWWLFALNNLLLTCVIEEVFFRGFIQNKLTKAFNPSVGLVIASLLFGIAHFAGGLSYVLVATLAGFLYGLVYLNTGRLWQAIVIHFMLNMTHLYLFTYPLQKL